MENSESSEGGSLEVTPTWAVALVCSVFVLASFGVERGIHYGGKWLRRHRQISLNQALDKMKEELMLLGFISLLLTVFQSSIASICVPHSFSEHMLPCKKHVRLAGESPHSPAPEGTHSRKLLFDAPLLRRLLAEAEGGGAENAKCLSKGKVPFVSREGLHQLHIFIFVLAVVHVVYSCLTLLLGRYKIHGWRAWETQAMSEVEPGPGVRKHHRVGRQSTFLRKHANPKWVSSAFLSWIVCFFRQFGRSVTKTDYQALRRGFIQVHRTKSTFDFHRYIFRVLEDDFKKVVGISLYLWLFVVVFLLLNVNGWHTYFWIAFIPLVLLLVIGTKLQSVMMSLAVEIAEEQKNTGAPVVKPRDQLFWFNRPRVILYLLHFILFQNAFELAFFFWIWATFGFNSCFMENLAFVIVRLVIGVIVQVLCSYSTLPLYALVTQMGTHYKAAIFNDQVQSALTSWHAKAKDKAKKRSSVHGPHGDGEDSSSGNGHHESKAPVPNSSSEVVPVVATNGAKPALEMTSLNSRSEIVNVHNNNTQHDDETRALRMESDQRDPAHHP